MGKKLNTLLGRSSKTHKLKTLANLTIARITILKNHRHVRCSHALSDVVQLLNLGHQDHALLRVEHVMKEQNKWDVFVMIEKYCHLLIERVELVHNYRECPDELNEVLSSLIFAASRCGEFPELQEIRGIFTSEYGKEFVDRAVDLRDNCRVNPKMIQKLSRRQASLESRQKLLNQIAYDNGITLHVEDDVYEINWGKQEINLKEKQLQPNEAANLKDFHEEKAGLERTFSSSSLDTDIDCQYDEKLASNLSQTAPLDEEIVFDETDEEDRDSIPWLKHHHSCSDKESNLPINKFQKTINHKADSDESLLNKGYKLHCQSPKWKTLNPPADPLTYSEEKRSKLANTCYLNAENPLYSRQSAFRHR